MALHRGKKGGWPSQVAQLFGERLVLVHRELEMLAEAIDEQMGETRCWI